LARRGRDKEALACAHEAVEALSKTDNYWLIADSLSTLADVHRIGGRRAQAIAAAAEAMERYEHKEIRLLARESRRILSELRG
jgi:hypothetical protein